MTPIKVPKSNLSSHDEKTIWYGQDNLVEDLLGKVDFIDVFLKHSFGFIPTPAQRLIVNAILVTLMEHGLTPSALSARMVYSSSPENLQAGVAAGLLAVGSRFVGTMEPCAALLLQINTSPDPQVSAKAIADDFRARRAPVPGFGHHLHRPDDPRAIALLALARTEGVAGAYCEALLSLGSAVDAAAGRHICINATGAIGALLGDLGIAPRMMRSFAVLARTAGLIAHIAEEQIEPTDRFIWDLVDRTLSTPHGDDQSNGEMTF